MGLKADDEQCAEFVDSTVGVDPESAPHRAYRGPRAGFKLRRRRRYLVKRSGRFIVADIDGGPGANQR